jgi:hypothetical protein
MKALQWFTLLFGGFVVLAARSPGAPPSCPPPAHCSWVFHIETTEEPYTETVRVQNKWTARATTTVRELPATRLVPVSVVDPCTGCARTELYPESCKKKVTTTVLEVTPPCEEYSCKTEKKTRRCTTITVHKPAGSPGSPRQRCR